MSLSTFKSSRELEESMTLYLYSLSYCTSSLFATVLEDTIEKFRILIQCSNELRLLKTKMDMTYLCALKYNVEQPDTDELESIDPLKIDCDEYKLNKLEKDRKLFLDTIIATYTDLSINNSFKALVDDVNATEGMHTYRLMLIDDEAKNRLTRRELNRQLRQQRNHLKSAIYDNNAVIEDLKTQVEDSAMNSEINGRYITNWQGARTEMNNQAIRDREAGPSETIEYYKQRTDHEQRIHSEVEMLINIVINEKLTQVEYWMNKYDKDIEAIDLKIQIIKNEYQIAMDQRIAFEETLESHETKINKWIQFKDERERKRQYLENMTKSAITVQAWWRGLLVRLQLGPYKVVRRRGPAPAPTGKGKKK